jgi:hypothetical protein
MPTTGIDQAAVPLERHALPPPMRTRPGDTTMRREHRRVNPFTIVMAVLVAAGLVGLIAWQAAPWLIQSPPKEAARTDAAAKQAPPPASAPAPEPNPPQPPAEEKPSPSAAQAQPPAAETPAPKPPEPAAPAPTGATPKTQPEETLPEPPNKPTDPVRPPPDRAEQKKTAPGTQAVGIITKPPGALASLDGHSTVSCHTPCTLTAPPGRHFVEVTLDGYQTEHREIAAGSGPRELPTIALHEKVGVLLLSSEPTGASISVNGKVQDKTTPAQLTLTPGSYNIMISKDGRSESRVVQIQDGSMKTMKFDFRGQ